MLVGLSGGADSLALAAALSFEAPKAGVRAGAVVIDHGLQARSAEVAERAAAQARGLGLDPVRVLRVDATQGAPGARSSGPEAAARDARYRAFETACVETGARWIMTAHTRDDQAEQVLLALARGSGARALAGIPRQRRLAGGAVVVRPFVGEEPSVTRLTTTRACAAQRLEPWRDPHNTDPSYTRVRVRERILPLLEQELGPGIADSLARTALLAAEDADALDALADEIAQGQLETSEGETAVSAALLATHPAAVRNRIIRRIAEQDFGEYLTREHTLAIAALGVAWRGQGPIHVPGITVHRSGDRLIFHRRVGSPRESTGATQPGVP